MLIYKREINMIFRLGVLEGLVWENEVRKLKKFLSCRIYRDNFLIYYLVFWENLLIKKGSFREEVFLI